MSTALRWARADALDVVEVIPRRRARRALPASSTFVRRLDRWRARIARQRAIVVVRRHLLVLAVLVVAAEIVVLATGNGHRPAWLIAPLLLALVDGAVVMARGIPADRAAHMLDADLGLHDRVGTALELQAAASAPSGLGALVVDEANTALDDSLGSARAVGRASRAEWGWLLAVVAALVAVALVSWNSSSGSVSHRGNAAGLSSSRAGHGAAGGGPSGSRSASASRRAGSLRHAPKLPRGRNLEAGGVYNSSHAALNNGSNQYGHGNALSAKQLAAVRRQGLAGAGASAGVAGSTAPSGAGGASKGGTTAAHGASGAGTQTKGKPQSGLGAGGLAAAKSGSGSGAGAGSTPAPSGSRERSGSSASGVSPSAAGGYNHGSGGAPSGGDSAGGSRAASIAGLSLVPQLQGRSRLPLQASYSPAGSNGSSRSEGTSATGNGGGGHSRTAQAGTGAPSASTANLALIPPTSNATSAPSVGLLQGYFGTSDQLTFSRW
jgi:hypothetical protein